MKKFQSLFLVMCLLITCAFGSISVKAEANMDSSEEALRLINDKVALEMQAHKYDDDEYNEKINAINSELNEIGVKKMSNDDLTEFLENTATPGDAQVMLDTISAELGESATILSDGPPCPEGNDKIDFYWTRTYVEDTWIYSVIASPVANANHSCNTVSQYTDFKSKLGGSLKNLVQIYTDKVIGLIPVVQWVPYEVFTDLVFNGTGTGQLEDYEARLITRTVHQFIYLQNSADQWVYYGSANCVHINVEEIARKYVGSQLKTSAENHYYLDIAPDYYEWPEVCVGNNRTGYNVTRKYSFINRVQVKVANNTAITANVVTATLPIHVTT